MANSKQMARSEDFRTPPCRLSFAQNLFEARSMEEGRAKKYGATLIFPKSALREKIIAYDGAKVSFEDIVGKVIIAEWKDAGIQRAKSGLIRSPFLAGDSPSAHSKTTGELHPGMGPDVFFIRVGANEDRPPVIRYRSANIPATKEEVYSGCRGFAVINAFAWHNDKQGDGISFGISYFQKTGDDEPFAGTAGQVDAQKWYEKIEDSGTMSEDGGSADSLFG